MNKITFFIISFISVIVSWLFAFFMFNKTVPPISEQIDMKTQKAKFNWMSHIAYWPCQGICKNYSNTSRWWGSWFGWK